MQIWQSPFHHAASLNALSDQEWIRYNVYNFLNLIIFNCGLFQKWLAHFYYTLNIEKKNDNIFNIIDQK